LRAGVELDWWQVHLQHGHVLHDEGIGPGVMELPSQLAGRFEFFLVQDGVDRDKDVAVEAVGKVAQAGNLGHGIARAIARPEGRATDIDCIGTVTNSLDTKFGIFRRREEFKRVGWACHGALVNET
jgi:hypothetical protein